MDAPNHADSNDPNSPIESSDKITDSSVSVPPLAGLLNALLSNQNTLRKFLSLTGGSILYCLSALSILYGIAQIITPLLAKSNILKETLPCVLTLNIYELALLGVLLLIVLWRDITDDAISLVLLVALFLIASGAVLSVVALAGPQICLYIGLACVALGIAKLSVMRRFISLRLSTLSLFGLAVVLSWNFLTSSLIAQYLLSGSATPEAARDRWLLGWLAMMGGAALVLADAIRTEPGQTKPGAAKMPFLRTPAMVWVFALMLLTAAGLHQYGMAHMLAIQYAFGDFIPLIALGTLLMPQLIRTLSRQCQDTEAVVCFAPLAAIAFAIAGKSIIARPGIPLELLWSPPVILGVTGLLILWLGIRHKRPYFSYVFLAYGLGFLLTVGFSPDRPHQLNWCLFGTGLVLILLILGAVKKNIALCLVGVFVMAGGLASMGMLAPFATATNMRTWSVFTGIIGLGSIGVSLGFGRKTQKALTIFAAACLTTALIDYLGWSLSLRDPAVAASIFALSAALWLRTKHILAIILLCAPVPLKAYVLARDMPSWGYVFLSFALLLSGAIVSIFCKPPKPAQEPSKETLSEE